MEHIAATMRTCGKKNVDYIEIQSDYGHDAFLVEIDKIDQYVRDALC
jgi:homoserine O-acetyltransferase